MTFSKIQVFYTWESVDTQDTSRHDPKLTIITPCKYIKFQDLKVISISIPRFEQVQNAMLRNTNTFILAIFGSKF